MGNIANIGNKLGVDITNDPNTIFKKGAAELVIHTTAARFLSEVFDEIRKPISARMNVITANVETSMPNYFDEVIAAKIKELAIENDVTVLGTGSAHVADRILLALTEQCTQVQSINFEAHKDVSQFSNESSRTAFWIGMTID